MELTDAMRETLNGYANTLYGQGRSDPNGMIIGLAREHNLERRDAIACYRQWEREVLEQYRQSAEEIAAAFRSEHEATGNPQAKADAERWEARANGVPQPQDPGEVWRADQALAIWRGWHPQRMGDDD